MYRKKRIERLERLREVRGGDSYYTDERILEWGREHGLPDDRIFEIWWRVVRGRYVSHQAGLDLMDAFLGAAHELGIEYVMEEDEVEPMRQWIYEHWRNVGISGRQQSLSEFRESLGCRIVKSRAEFYAELKNAANPSHEPSDPAARK